MVTVTQLPASSRILSCLDCVGSAPQTSRTIRAVGIILCKNDKHLNFQVGIYCSKPDDGWQDASDMIDGPLARRLGGESKTGREILWSGCGECFVCAEYRTYICVKFGIAVSSK